MPLGALCIICISYGIPSLSPWCVSIDDCSYVEGAEHPFLRHQIPTLPEVSKKPADLPMGTTIHGISMERLNCEFRLNSDGPKYPNRRCIEFLSEGIVAIVCGICIYVYIHTHKYTSTFTYLSNTCTYTYTSYLHAWTLRVRQDKAPGLEAIPAKRARRRSPRAMHALRAQIVMYLDPLIRLKTRNMGLGRFLPIFLLLLALGLGDSHIPIFWLLLYIYM